MQECGGHRVGLDEGFGRVFGKEAEGFLFWFRRDLGEVTGIFGRCENARYFDFLLGDVGIGDQIREKALDPRVFAMHFPNGRCLVPEYDGVHAGIVNRPPCCIRKKVVNRVG